MKIKDLSRIELPREKLEHYGEQKLLDHELLAIILGSGIQGLNVLELSKRVLEVIKKEDILTLEKLMKIKGLGKAKALQMLAMMALGMRLQNDEKPELLKPEDVWRLSVDFRDSKREHFVAFYLDTQNKLIERIIISIGTLNASLVHPREVFEPAVRLCAASVIVAHNHPSGNLEPSSEDREVTLRLRGAGKLLGVELVDHVIVTKIAHKSLQ